MKERIPVIEFTTSRMNAFLECERREFFQFRAADGKGVEPIRRETFFLEGEFGHYSLSKWYETGMRGQPLMLRANMIKRIGALKDALGPLDPEDDDDLNQRLAAMIGACHGYKARYATDFDKYKILFVEEPFEFDYEGVVIRGKIDLVVQDKESKEVGFMEHKFLSMFSAANYGVLPITLQQVIYCLGTQKLAGVLPRWYVWNVVKKSSLRRRTTPGPENLNTFEARVTDQYLKEPDKMFVRTPPKRTEEKIVESAMASFKRHVVRWGQLVESKELPPMRFTSCDGKFGNGCPFAPACIEAAAGNKEGWNSPKCDGLYRIKKELNPELKKEKD